MAFCLMPLLFLAAVANHGIRLSVKIKEEGSDDVEQRRVMLKMPC